MKKTWGDILGTIALVFAIVSAVFGLLALIPVLGLVFAYLTGIAAVIALGLGIPAVIKAVGKGKCVTSLVMGGLMLTWAVIRYFWVIAAIANAPK